MKLHIYLFRHGQTYFNRDKRFTGWKDSKLTPKGRADAKKLARELKSKKIDVAFVTRLSRSRDTMREVLKYHSECRAVITNDKMIERSYGKLAGQYHKDIIAKYGKERFDKWHRAYDFPPPGGESINMVEKRVLSFIKELLAFMKREKVNVAIAAHGNSIRPFRRYFEHLTIQQMTKLENPWDAYFDYVIEV